MHLFHDDIARQPFDHKQQTATDMINATKQSAPSPAPPQHGSSQTITDTEPKQQRKRGRSSSPQPQPAAKRFKGSTLPRGPNPASLPVLDPSATNLANISTLTAQIMSARNKTQLKPSIRFIHGTSNPDAAVRYANKAWQAEDVVDGNLLLVVMSADGSEKNGRVPIHNNKNDGNMGGIGVSWKLLGCNGQGGHWDIGYSLDGVYSTPHTELDAII